LINKDEALALMPEDLRKKEFVIFGFLRMRVRLRSEGFLFPMLLHFKHDMVFY